MKFRIMILSLVLLAAAAAQAGTFDVDVSHSNVGFKIKHMMVSNVRGSFTDFEGSFTLTDGDPKEWSVTAEIRTASIDPADEQRDDHLRNPEFQGRVEDPWGNTRVGFEATGEIDRKDFGMNWSKTLDSGGLMVGNTVKIELEIEGVLRK